MTLLRTIYRRLDDAQRMRWFRMLATAIVLLVCGGYFGYTLAVSYNIDAQRQELNEALANQNANRGDMHAVSIKTSGTATVGGRTYGGPEYLKPRIELFDAEGNLIQVAALVESFLSDQRPAIIPDWLLNDPVVTWLLALAGTAWLLAIVWMNLTVAFALTVVATALPVLIFTALDRPQLVLAFGGMGVLTFTFVLLIRLVLLALNQSYQVPAVAHTVIKEASRRGLALVFIILLLVVLPLLPLLLDASQPLRFRIQSYISWSLGLSFTVAAIMTLFFSCASVAFEIRDRQIWQLMTKPLARVNYLLGKWVGVLSLNMIILIVAGISTFTFVRYLRSLPVPNTEAGQLDLLAVTDEVLTARVGGRPIYPRLDAEQLRLRVNQVIENDPDLSQLERVPMAKRAAIENQLQTAHLAGLRSVPLNGERTYVFTGLKEAKRLSTSLTLRYKFYILRDDEHTTFNALFVFNDDPNLRYRSTFVPSISHSLPIPTQLVRDDGTLKVTIVNLTPPIQGQGGAINFEENQFEILYKAGTFEGNFIRALITIWIKLAFLAALGIGCSTFLNFPVACLLSFTVFIAGMLGPFLADALEWYNTYEMHELDWSNIGMVVQWAFELVTRYIALGVVFLLSSFGEYRPTQNLVEGRLIPWSAVLDGFLKLSLLWSMVALAVGYLVLRKRQLAIYSGHG